MAKRGVTVLSSELWKNALELFPGGVNSPVRAAVKPFPFYTKEGRGAFLITEDGRKLIDFVLGYGPLILGHSPPRVKEKVIEQIEKGWLYGTPSRAEVELARKITSHIRSIDKIRFVNSGTEATMNAIRLARGFTKREKIIKFDGNYHGAHDYVLASAGSAATEFSVPDSDGIPKDVLKTVIVCPYNQLECVEKHLKNEDVAAVIVEPIMGNMGVIPANQSFLEGLRELTRTYNTLLIFDEVITGFRVGLEGAQGYYTVYPDLTTLGKIIGGGFPIGAFGGKREIMENLTPSGKVFNAGTFNANPISMVAGIATIEELEKGKAYEIANKAAKEISEELDKAPLDHVVNSVKSMFQIFFGVKSVENADDARKANKGKYIEFQKALLDRGVFFPPSQFESVFTSSAHTEEVVNETLDKIRKVLSEMR